MNILVISSYFGPETSVGVLRVNAFVKYWANQGHNIHVVTMPFSGDLPEELKVNSNVKITQVAPLLLKGRQSANGQSYAKGATGYRKKLVDFQYWLKRKFLANYLDPRLLWWPKAAYFICTKLSPGFKFDFIFSTAPSYTTHSAAAFVKLFNKKLFWVADYRDLWFGNPIFPGCALVRFIERQHERLVLKKADLIVSINPPLIKELQDIHGDRNYLEITNGFDDKEVDVFRSIQLKPKDRKIRIVYAGSILPGLQNPTPLFQAIKELAEARLIQEGDISIDFYGDVTALADFSISSDELVGKFLNKYGKVSRKEILHIQKNADLLLFLGSQPISSNFGSTTGVVSGKIFEYLISGTEIMAIGVTEGMLVAKMLSESRTGDFYSDEIEKIKARILNATTNGVKKLEPDMGYLGQFRRSVLAAKLISEIDKLIKQKQFGF